MKAAEWIDRVKQARGWESDYRAAKELGLSRNTISNYRGAVRYTLDDSTAIKVATALDEKPEIILLDQAMERAKNDEVRSALGRVLKRLGGVAAGVAVAAVALAGASNPLSAQAKPVSADGSSVHYVNINMPVESSSGD